MNHRHLGESGLVVSEIACGDWITHGSQVEKREAIACVRAALEDSARAAGVKLDAEVRKRIDQALGEAVVRDPQKTRSPARRP